MIDELNKLDVEIAERENWIVNLNGVVHQLEDKLDFDRRLKKLSRERKDLEDNIEGARDDTDDLHDKLNHIRDRTRNNKYPEKLDEIEDRLVKLKGDLKDLNGVEDNIEDRIAVKYDQIGDKQAKDLSHDEIEGHISDLDQIHDDLVDGKEQFVKLDEELKRSQKLTSDLQDEIERELKNQLERDIKVDDADTDKTQKNLDLAEQKMKALEAKLQEKLDTLEDPDRLAEVERLKKKVEDLNKKQGSLDKDNDKNRGNLGLVKDKAAQIDRLPKDSKTDAVDGLMDTLDDIQPVSMDIADNKRKSEDLLNKLDDLQEELGNYDAQARKGLIDECTGSLQDKLNDLDDLENKLKALEGGVQDTKGEIKDRIDGIDSKDPRAKKLGLLNNKLGAVSDDTEDMRAKKDELKKEVEEMLDQLNNMDPSQVKLNDVIKIKKQCNDKDAKFDDISKDVDEGQKKLDDINNDLQNLLDSAKADERHKALKKLRDAGNHLDELTRSLDNSNILFQEFDKVMDKVDEYYDDKTKILNGDPTPHLNDGQKETHKDLSAVRDEYAQSLADLDTALKNLKQDEANIEDFQKLTVQIDAVDKGVVKDTQDAHDLNNQVGENKQKAMDLLKELKKVKVLMNQAEKKSDKSRKGIDKMKDDIGEALKIAETLKADLDITPVSKDDDRYKKYKEYCDIVDTTVAKCKEADKILKPLDDKVASLQAQLDGLTDTVLNTPQIEKILKELDDTNKALDDLSTKVGKIKDGLNEALENEIKDFLNEFKNDKLYDAEKKLKQAESDLEKLEKRLREVDGDNSDFLNRLDRENNDPDEPQRVELLKGLAEESKGTEAKLKKIDKEKDKIGQVFDKMKEKLRADHGTIPLNHINEVLEDADKCAGLVAKKLKELDGHEDDINDRKNKLNNFLSKSGEREVKIKDFSKLLGSNQDLLDKLKERIGGEE